MKIIWLQDYITVKLLALITNRIQLLAAVSFLCKDLFFIFTVGEASRLTACGRQSGRSSLQFTFLWSVLISGHLILSAVAHRAHLDAKM